jgi:hypothetical protein
MREECCVAWRDVPKTESYKRTPTKTTFIGVVDKTPGPA